MSGNSESNVFKEKKIVGKIFRNGRNVLFETNV